MCDKCRGRGVIYDSFENIGVLITPCDDKCRRQQETRYQAWRKRFYESIGKPMPGSS